MGHGHSSTPVEYLRRGFNRADAYLRAPNPPSSAATGLPRVGGRDGAADLSPPASGVAPPGSYGLLKSKPSAAIMGLVGEGVAGLRSRMG